LDRKIIVIFTLIYYTV